MKIIVKSFAEVLILAALLFVGVTQNTVHAQNLEWIGGGADSNWSDKLNWDPGVVPGLSDHLIVGGPFETYLDGDFSIDGLDVKSGASVRTNGQALSVGSAGVQLFDGGQLTVTDSSSDFGGLLTSDLTVDGGELFLEDGSATIQGSMTSQGRVTGAGKLTFTGSGNVFTNGGPITVRSLSPGSQTTLTLAATSSAAKIDLDGTDVPGWVILDSDTQMNLLVPLTDVYNSSIILQSGSGFSHPFEMVMGAGGLVNVQAGSDSATIDTNGYKLTDGAQIRVRSGTLRMTNRLSVDANSTILMQSGGGGTLRLNGESSIFGNVTVHTGTSLVVESGTTTIDSSRFEAIGGNLTVDSGATMAVRSGWTSGSANDYRGRLIVRSGGTMDIEHATQSLLELQSDGEIFIHTGGRWQGDDILAHGSIFVTGDLNENAVFASKLTLDDGGTLQANAPVRLDGGFELTSGANVFGNTGSGRIFNTGPMSVESGLSINTELMNSGSLSITGDMGSISIESLEQTASGTISLRIGDGDYDRVFTNELVLNGTLSVELEGGFVPEAWDEFAIFSGNVSGEFAEMDLPSLPNGLGWQFYTTGANPVLTVVPGITGDFDGDGDYSCADVDSLVAAIVNGNTSLDLNQDNAIDTDDLDAWLAEAGAAENASGNPYLYGDANLDSVVDASDFNIWNSNKFSAAPSWCSGDFNADGVIDTSDFNFWNSNKFQTADSTVAVPETHSSLLLICGIIGLMAGRRRFR